MLIREMSPEECRSTLAATKFARLACSRSNQPYVVPISITTEDLFVYSFSMPGQKLEWLRMNALVCLEVDEIRQHDDWMSVVVEGRFEELSAASDREHAHDLLQRRAMWWEPGASHIAGAPSAGVESARAAAVPVFYRISIERLTGRMCGGALGVHARAPIQGTRIRV